MTDCGCMKGRMKPGCERHDPMRRFTARGRFVAVWWQFAGKLNAWRGAA